MSVHCNEWLNRRRHVAYMYTISRLCYFWLNAHAAIFQSFAVSYVCKGMAVARTNKRAERTIEYGNSCVAEKTERSIKPSVIQACMHSYFQSCIQCNAHCRRLGDPWAGITSVYLNKSRMFTECSVRIHVHMQLVSLRYCVLVMSTRPEERREEKWERERWKI